MEKFKVLQNNQRFMSSILCINDDQEKKKNPWMKSSDNFFTSIPLPLILFILCSTLLSSAVKMSNQSNSFTVRLAASLIFIAMFQAITVFLDMGVHMQKIAILYRTLQAIVDSEAEHDQIHGIFWRAEQKYRKYSKMFAITLLVYDQSAYLSAFCYSICWILTGNNDASIWPVIYELSVPFDTKTIGGWYLLFLITYCMDFAYLMCLILATTHFIGSCIYIVAICEHFDLIMQNVEANIKRNLREKNRRKFSETNAKINVQIREAIQIHIMIYDIFDTVADITSASIFILIPPNVVVFGITMYQIHQMVIGGNFDGAIVYILTLIYVLFWPYLFCYFANLAVDRIELNQRTVYNLNWYNFPPDLRKYFILILAQSQRTVCFDGLSLVRCTLASFGALIRSSFSYYLAFVVISNRT